MAEQDSDFFDWRGGDWVAKEVVANIKSGHAQFIVNTGDVMWWGKQGSNPAQLLVSDRKLEIDTDGKSVYWVLKLTLGQNLLVHRIRFEPRKSHCFFDSFQKLDRGPIAMFFDVMDNQHGGSECNSCPRDSNLTVAFAGRQPFSIRPIHIQNSMAGREGFFRKTGFSA